MSTKAYVLVETRLGQTREVVKQLAGIPGIVSADAVTGPWDIIAVVSAHDLNAVGEIVTENFHAINGISRTVTCLAVSVG